MELFNTLWTRIEPAADSIRLFGSTSSSSSRDAETLVSSLELDHAYIEAQPQRDAFSKSQKLPTKDEFFLVLVRLRLGLLEIDLAYTFEVSQSYVYGYLFFELSFKIC